MTRTSTDFGAGGTDADEAPRQLSCARAFTVVVIVLALICTALVVVTQSRGPRLDETRVDASAVTQRTDQQARLFLNESVSTVRPSQVRITPTTPFTVSTAGTVVTVQFSRRLHSATRYSVAVDGVTSIFGSRDADVETTFTTANAEVLTLDRSATAGGVDRIVEASVNTVGRDVVYEARGIQAFASIGTDLVVAADDGGASTLSIVARDGTREDLLLPGPGLVRSLSLDAPTGILVFGFTATGAAPDSAERLYSIDLAGVHRAEPLKGADRRALVATAWGMTPGAPVVVTRAPGGTITRADLGLEGTTTTVSADSVTVGERSLIESPGTVRAGSDTARLATSTRSIIVGSRALYTAPSSSRLSSLGVSPNGQYLTVVSAPVGARSDGATIAPAPVGATTLVLDAESGALVASFAGASLHWN